MQSRSDYAGSVGAGRPLDGLPVFGPVLFGACCCLVFWFADANFLSFRDGAGRREGLSSSLQLFGCKQGVSMDAAMEPAGMPIGHSSL